VAEIVEVLAPLEARFTHSEGTQNLRYRTTFFPSAIRKAAATPVDSKSRSEVSGLEIHMAQTPVLSISGVVLGIPQGSNYVHVGALSRSDPSSRLDQSAAADGRFSFANLDPGSYRIYAMAYTGDERVCSSVQEIVLTDANVDGVGLALGPGITVKGVIVAADRGKQPGYAVTLSGDDFHRTDADTDGKFEFRSVEPGQYHVNVVGLGDSYVQSIELNGLKNTGMLMFPAGRTARLRITISSNGGRLSGKVTHSLHEQASSWSGVWLVPDAQDRLPNDFRFSPLSDEETYTFQGLPPGTYWLGLGSSAQRFEDPDELDEFIHDPATVLVTINEREKLVRDLKMKKSK